MTTAHKRKLKEAKDAINGVFSDTSVPRSKTRESLQDLRDEIGELLDLLNE